MVQTAVRMVLDPVEEAAPGPPPIVQPSLVVRESTSRAPDVST
jgi:hypothetical protein